MSKYYTFFVELHSLEQQLEEAQTENFNIKQMKDLFEQKAAQLATEIAGKLIKKFLAHTSVSFPFVIIHPRNKHCILVIKYLL